jgi:hypothetical protein
MRVVSMLMALFAITPPIIVFQNRETLPTSGFAIQITRQGGQSFHLLLAKTESKNQNSFTLPPGEIVKRAEKDSEQVSEVYINALPRETAGRLRSQ